MATKGTGKLLLCAIDFGTTYSGYAYSFRDKPIEILTPQTWYAGNTELASLKTPTCLLIKPDGKRMFGYDAENEYAALTENDEHHDCYFFQHFKMMLHNNNAGLENEQISFALEPEVASIFCQQVPVEKMATPTKFEVSKAGTEYMVVDLGGGAADITVHRKEVDGSPSALHAPTGGPWED